jgi:hypothetical protein
MGMLIRKHQRHPCSAKTPPSSGPSVVPMAKVTCLMAKYEPRLRSGMMSHTIISAKRSMPPVPRPCTIRPKIKTAADCAPPQIALPTAKTATASIMGYFLPHMSPSWLYTGWNIVLARRKAVATQEKLVPRSSASEIVGSAVLVTLPSRAERRRGMQMAIKERQKPGPRFHVIEGVQDGSEGGRVGRLNFSFTTHFDTSLSVNAVQVEAVAVEEPDAREDGLEGCSLGDMLKIYFRRIDLEDRMNVLNEVRGTS